MRAPALAKVLAVSGLLAVAGSAYRLWHMRLDEAQHCLEASLRMAEEVVDRPAVGDLLQRFSYVVADRGEHAHALRISERAMQIWVVARDMTRIGQTLVDQGMFLFYLDHPREAIASAESALEYLPESELHSRCTAFQLLGKIYQQLGEVEKAYSFANLAESVLPVLGPLLSTKLSGMQASILTDLGRFDDAERLWRKVVEMFRPLHYGETALATVELARVQLLRGRYLDAWATAVSIRGVVFSLEKNKIVSAAIADLLRTRKALSLDLVESVKATLEKARKHRDWCSLRVPSN